MNKVQLKHLLEINLLKDIFQIDIEEAKSMFLSNDYKDIEKAINGDLGLRGF